jgi:serine/threonine protein phosphatase PrpC
MGSTATVLVCDPEGGRSAVVGNIGDSRVYCLRAGEMRQLTHDHTVEREILRRNSSRPQTPATEARASMLAHVLTRAVGVGTEARLEWRKVDMREGDVFLLCSDGVYGFLTPQELKDAVGSGGSAKEVAARISTRVAEHVAPDNFSAIVVKIGGRA